MDIRAGLNCTRLNRWKEDIDPWTPKEHMVTERDLVECTRTARARNFPSYRGYATEFIVRGTVNRPLLLEQRNLSNFYTFQTLLLVRDRKMVDFYSPFTIALTKQNFNAKIKREVWLIRHGDLSFSFFYISCYVTVIYTFFDRRCLRLSFVKLTKHSLLYFSSNQSIQLFCRKFVERNSRNSIITAPRFSQPFSDASQFSFESAIVEPLSAAVHVHRQVAKFPFDQGYTARYTVLILWTARESFQFAAYSFLDHRHTENPPNYYHHSDFHPISIDFYRYRVQFSPGLLHPCYNTGILICETIRRV